MWTIIVSFLSMSLGLLCTVPTFQMPALLSMPEDVIRIPHVAIRQWMYGMKTLTTVLLVAGVYTLYAKHAWAFGFLGIPMYFAVRGMYMYRTRPIAEPKKKPPTYVPIDIQKETKDAFKGFKRGFLNNRNGIF